MFLEEEWKKVADPVNLVEILTTLKEFKSSKVWGQMVGL